MKRLWLGFLALQLAAQPQITLTAPPVRLGSVVTVSVSLTGSAGFSALATAQWTMPASPGALTLAGKMIIAPGAASAGKTVTCAVTPGGVSLICVVHGGATVLADGVLATVSFPQPASLALPLTSMVGVNGAGDAPGITINSGPLLTIAPLSRCDVNADGVIDLLDVRYVIDEIEGVIVPPLTDLDGNGRTDVVDVQRVINAAVGGVCRIG